MDDLGKLIFETEARHGQGQVLESRTKNSSTVLVLARTGQSSVPYSMGGDFHASLQERFAVCCVLRCLVAAGRCAAPLTVVDVGAPAVNCVFA